MAVGGDGVARESSGRVVFVQGALPGELVLAEFTDERTQWARAKAIGVVEPSPERRTPPCPHVARGCGGCDLQHASAAGQLDVRAAIVSEALRRQGKLAAIPPIERRELPDHGYRTTIRVAVEHERAGYRARWTHDTVVTDSCLVAHPLAEELLVDGVFGEATEATIRVGARTGERLVLASPSADGVRMPDGVRVVGADELAAGKRAWFHDEVAGRRWRISAESFFQIRPDGAEALVEVVGDMLARVEPGSDLVDLYAGVGLFSGTIGSRFRTTAVENAPSAVADARVNLATERTKIIGNDVATWTPRPAQAVIADPSRSGLGATVVGRIVRTGARDVVLVGCDAAAFGRDVGLFTNAGYDLQRVVVVDLFAQTSHVEAVAHLTATTATPVTSERSPAGR